MQTILRHAIAAAGFIEVRQTPYPEFIVGSAYGMPQAVGWVYRDNVYLAAANGTPEQIVSTFEQYSTRALELEALRREPVADGWIIDALVARTYSMSTLTRIVATGRNGEASILFESDPISEAELAQLQSVAVGRTLRRVVDSINRSEKNKTSEAA